MDTTAELFLAVASQYQLGTLDTEAQHPVTLDLSHLAVSDLKEAIRKLYEVDLQALEKFATRSNTLPALAAAIESTLAAGRKIFLCGCGATGRLSLSLELFCREGLLPPEFLDRVIGFMAGGDLALIKSIENFEDHPEFGSRQLEELGFVDGDLLISSTEGGETPFVIGATERAAELSSNHPFFLYCNPDTELSAVAERSRRVIENPNIHKVNLAVGPMGLTGSTRMQSSTVLMAAIAFAFHHRKQPAEAAKEVVRFRDLIASIDFTFLVPFTEKETAAYQNGEFVIYEPGGYGITVLTDTTERSPTFTLAPFEHQQRPDEAPSLCHLHLEGQPDEATAWRALLHREPRTLEWPEVRDVASREVLRGYDFSDRLLPGRVTRTNGARHLRFHIYDEGTSLVLDFDGLRHSIDLGAIPSYQRHLVLKLILNTHSTLIMGRLGKYLDNLMTWVKPSNFKLIDRCIRYVRMLVQRRTGAMPDYALTARRLFEVRDRLLPGEPIVMKTMETFLK